MTREKEIKANAKNRKKACRRQRKSGRKKEKKHDRYGQAEDRDENKASVHDGVRLPFTFVRMAYFELDSIPAFGTGSMDKRKHVT